MSSVNYSLNNKGVRLIKPNDAWVFNKSTGKKNKLNPNYHFVGKLNISMPNILISTSDKVRPKYKGDVSSLNNIAKSEIVNHFFDSKGNKTSCTKAYFGIKKK